MDLAGRRAWVVGASSGIGAAVAQELLDRGCLVAVSARRRAELEKVAQGQMIVVPLDVTDHDAVHAAASALSDDLGGLDLVVVVAGFWQQMSARGFDLDTFRRHIDVNLVGLAACVGAVLPPMLERGDGVIVGVASVAGYRGLPGAEGYGTSKAGQIYLLEALRAGLRGSGVRVQTVCPGFVRTPMTDANEFPMPFMVSAEQAARSIVDGIERERAEVVFPWPMAVLMKAARLVPAGLWPLVVAGRRRSTAGAPAPVGTEQPSAGRTQD